MASDQNDFPDLSITLDQRMVTIDRSSSLAISRTTTSTRLSNIDVEWRWNRFVKIWIELANSIGLSHRLSCSQFCCDERSDRHQVMSCFKHLIVIESHKRDRYELMKSIQCTVHINDGFVWRSIKQTTWNKFETNDLVVCLSKRFKHPGQIAESLCDVISWRKPLEWWCKSQHESFISRWDESHIN